MKILSEPKSIVNKILGSQEIKNTTTYRPFFYLKQFEIDGGLILFNLLTYETVFLESHEVSNYLSGIKADNDIVKKLISKWFLVPVDNDDLQLVRQVEDMLNLTNKMYSSNKYATFTILTTTDCNARCFYCVENGVKKRSMSAEMAIDVADFIIKNKLNRRILLRWFGGEPLYNGGVIDVICQRLSDAGVDFESYMITNGYLFDKDVISKAKDLWKLNRVQITLDGTEEKYNRIKNYIYKDESAFLRVINNIDLLSKADIKVRIRMNMDYNNVDDLYNLTDYLFNRFKDTNNIKIYSALIFEESCAYMKNIDTKSRTELLEKQIKLERYIIENGKYSISSEIHKNRLGHCMADDSNSVVILPDGNLGKCQSIIDSNFIGTIYDNVLNKKMIDWYKDIKTVSRDCDACIFRPACVYPKCCVMSLQNCTDLDKQVIVNRLEKQILKRYSEVVLNK